MPRQARSAVKVEELGLPEGVRRDLVSVKRSFAASTDSIVADSFVSVVACKQAQNNDHTLYEVSSGRTSSVVLH